MSNYQIYVDDKPTNIFYKVESKEEALVEYATDFVNAFIEVCGAFPDMAYFDRVKALEIYPIE